jgi:uncharacterized protein YndB with AHSA1/START domain/ribosomal protein S18 acetylase RimI-like enzyme
VRVVREIGLRVSPEEVWRALSAPDGRRGWYYRQAPGGEWRPGGRVEWRLEDGSLSEEWTLRELDPPRRLTAEGRWLFAPHLASEPPHLLTWELEPAAEGCRVRLVADFERAGAASRLFESEGEALLRGLRLEVDPGARAELARRDEIGEVVVRDLTPERLDDYLGFFDHEAFRDYPAWQGCYCMETHWGGSLEEWTGRTAADNRESMIQLVRQGQVTALLAYAGGVPAGWCNYGETTRLQGVLRRFELDAREQEGVGSVACFVIAAPYRGYGLARTLLEEACARLSQRGLRWAEAYPRREAHSPQAAYRGPMDMYLKVGFEPYREAGHTLIVRKELGAGPSSQRAVLGKGGD